MGRFTRGFRSMLPITIGVIPFGIVMGAVCSEARLSFTQSLGMTILVYAGASQLAAVELMTKNAATAVIVTTGLIINLRFLLYSAAMSPVVQKSSAFTKFITAYNLTDQTYSAMLAHKDKLKTNSEALEFYLGASLCMALAWNFSVIGGYIFGDFAPASWSLDYAVPLSFISLVIPTLKDLKYFAVAIFSSIISLLLNPLPYKVGLVTTAILAIALAAYLTKRGAPR